MTDFIELVPDPQVAKELSVTLMTLWRWDRDQRKIALGWPPRVKIGHRNFRERQAIEAFKIALIHRAIDERADDSPRPSRVHGAVRRAVECKAAPVVQPAEAS
jgi:hypothetical protein